MGNERIIDAGFDKNAILGNAPDTLEDVDDMTMREQRKARFSQDTRFRRYLANWVMAIVPAWLFCVILILCGRSILNMEKEIVITLLATTTVNVLGLAYIVLKGIFPESKDKK